MAGNPVNVKLWTEADVLLYDASTLPVDDIPDTITDPFVTTTGKWGFLGLLVGDAGLNNSRQWQETDIPAWGYGTILVASKDFSLTTTVSALEDNPVTQKIIWPGSDDTKLVVPNPLHAFFALEKRTADGKKHRRISTMPGRFWVQNDNDAEGAANPREINIRVFPNSNRELFLTQKSA